MTGPLHPGRRLLEFEETRLLSAEGLNAVFEGLHTGPMAEGDAFVLSVWHRIRDRLQLHLRAVGLAEAEHVTPAEVKLLQGILDDEVPKLRRLAAPLDYIGLVRDGYNK